MLWTERQINQFGTAIARKCPSRQAAGAPNRQNHRLRMFLEDHWKPSKFQQVHYQKFILICLFVSKQVVFSHYPLKRKRLSQQKCLGLSNCFPVVIPRSRKSAETTS